MTYDEQNDCFVIRYCAGVVDFTLTKNLFYVKWDVD